MIPPATIYLDHNATTPPHRDVLAAMARAAEAAWANPASVHGPGRAARAHVEDAREAVAALVGLDARDVVLTSGGTEANNLALQGRRRTDPPGAAAAVVVSRIEHPSVLRAAERLGTAASVELVWIDPEPSGLVDPGRVEAILARARSRVRLVSVQTVNHETGVVQPIAAIAAVVHRAGALLHTDAVQAVGRVDRQAWADADLVTVAAHKIRGPKGIGALACRPLVTVDAVLFGGAQERGLRPGTQDPVAAAGFAVAAHRAGTGPERYERVETLRDRLEAALIDLGRTVGSVPLCNGAGPRVPHVSNLSWPGWSGVELCAALDLEGVAVSSGSACSAGTAEPSPVLTAMLGEERARSAVRVSLGEETSGADVDRALEAWSRVLARGARS